MAISFSFIDTKIIPLKKKEIKSWIKNVIEQRGGKLGDISYIFCNDEYILNVNKEYLNHDYYTDIITFDYTEKDFSSDKIKISGDLFISIDTVKSNSEELGLDFNQELHRVIIHGVLHLLGLKDKTDKEAKEMRKAEEECLKSMML